MAMGGEADARSVTSGPLSLAGVPPVRQSVLAGLPASPEKYLILSAKASPSFSTRSMPASNRARRP